MQASALQRHHDRTGERNLALFAVLGCLSYRRKLQGLLASFPSRPNPSTHAVQQRDERPLYLVLGALSVLTRIASYASELAPARATAARRTERGAPRGALREFLR